MQSLDIHQLLFTIFGSGLINWICQLKHDLVKVKAIILTNFRVNFTYFGFFRCASTFCDWWTLTYRLCERAYLL